jgi:hypothetical protein
VLVVLVLLLGEGIGNGGDDGRRHQHSKPAPVLPSPSSPPQQPATAVCADVVHRGPTPGWPGRACAGTAGASYTSCRSGPILKVFKLMSFEGYQ